MLAEVRRLKDASHQLTETELNAVNKFFTEFMEHEYIYPIEVSREVGERAQVIGATYNLSPMDSIHVASAIEWNCDVLLAWDKQTLLNKFPNGEIDGVRILEPFWEGIIPMGGSDVP